MTSWDPDQYARYHAHREWPALDLMARIPGNLRPREVWDMGCGPGEQAAQLAARWPDARVRGFDSSPAMLARAKASGARVDWVQGDITAFAPDTPPDLSFTNAALQWVPDHAALFPRLVGMLAPGGVFACQVPVTWDELWHVQLRETAAEGPWAERLTEVRPIEPIAAPAQYHDWLSAQADTDIWSSTYLHVLTGEDPVVDWMSGTGLRPYSDALTDPEERAAFIDAYRAKTRIAFPRRPDGTTLFPFPRLFMVARRR